MNYLDNVVSLALDTSKCIGCQRCLQVCPRHVFDFSDKAKINNLDACIECGACKMNCPTGAISVNHGVGCAIAMYGKLVKKYKWLKPFVKDNC